MTRAVAYHDFLSGSGEPVYRVSFDCQSPAEREAVRIAGLSVVAPAAFQPNSPQPVSASYTTEAVSGGVAMPNCDGNNQFGQEGAQVGQVLAQAQHEAASSGDDCTATACLITRGSD